LPHHVRAGDAPADAFRGSRALLTVLPKTWHQRK
jgi:hypothetical protein